MNSISDISTKAKAKQANSIRSLDQHIWRQAGAFTITQNQVLYTWLFMIFGIVFLGITIDVALVGTLLVFLFATLFGLWLCSRTRIFINDSNLNVLGSFWLAKITLTLLLLYFGWIPQLALSSPSWGEDAQRFYYDAWQLVQNNWHPVITTNYQGVNYYYGCIFYLFGHNPVIPALINCIVTLLGTLFLIRCAYEFTVNRTQKDWTIGLLLLVPEVLWYDAVTGKEALLAVSIFTSVLIVGKYLADIRRSSLHKTLFIFGVFFTVILAMRTVMAIPVVVSIIVMAFLLPTQRKKGGVAKLLLIIIGLIAVSAGPLIQHLIGGTPLSYFETFQSILTLKANIAAKANWGEGSIGLLFAPHNILEFVLFIPPRMLMYILAPLPDLNISIAGLWNGYWVAWHSLMVSATSLIMMFSFPYVLAGTVRAWRDRKSIPAVLIIPITFWVMLIAVASGNIIIHVRYRLMFTLLFFACVWIGYTRCKIRELQPWMAAWYFVLLLGLLFYVSYKHFI